MPTPFEAEISSLLRANDDLHAVAGELARRWSLNILSESEQVDTAQFFVASGLYPELFREVVGVIDRRGLLPWAQIAEATGRARVRPEPKEIDALLEGANAQGAEQELIKSKQLDIYSRAIADRRQKIADQIREERRQRAENKKQDLKDKLQFVQSERLLDEEAKVFAEIEELFPEEKEFAQARDGFKLRWAKEFISKSSGVTDAKTDLAWRVDRLSEDQIGIRDTVVARAKELAETKPALAYDLALCLHFMDFNAEAIDVLSSVPDNDARSSPADWLRLELMIQARQFVSVLDECSRLEMKYIAVADSSFAVTYARARALHGLGQRDLAVDVLSGLVKIRPHYKSAHSLLLDWTGGEE